MAGGLVTWPGKAACDSSSGCQRPYFCVCTDKGFHMMGFGWQAWQWYLDFCMGEWSTSCLARVSPYAYKGVIHGLHGMLHDYERAHMALCQALLAFKNCFAWKLQLRCKGKGCLTTAEYLTMALVSGS